LLHVWPRAVPPVSRPSAAAVRLPRCARPRCRHTTCPLAGKVGRGGSWETEELAYIGIGGFGGFGRSVLTHTMHIATNSFQLTVTNWLPSSRGGLQQSHLSHQSHQNSSRCFLDAPACDASVGIRSALEPQLHGLWVGGTGDNPPRVIEQPFCQPSCVDATTISGHPQQCISEIRQHKVGHPPHLGRLVFLCLYDNITQGPFR
jgi:hypothetical protein